MNLPILAALSSDNSTYITFQKANLDFDREVARADGLYYFSHVVALDLPDWTSVGSPRIYNNIALPSNTNPNDIIPAVMSRYLENICRSNISNDGETPTEEVVELAFWKTLKYLGMSKTEINNSIVFSNGIFANNFIETDTNNGWVEIICQIPNKCKLITPQWNTLSKVRTLVSGINDDQNPLFDSSNVYDFTGMKDVLNFNMENNANDVVERTFKFNVLLLFYTDHEGTKLHGINFIHNFESTSGQEYSLKRLEHITNKVKSVGYQFLFNMKSVNNQVSRTHYYDQNAALFYVNQFETVMGRMAQFFEAVRPRVDYNFTIDIDKTQLGD
jgi:hypothetical protein